MILVGRVNFTDFICLEGDIPGWMQGKKDKARQARSARRMPTITRIVLPQVPPMATGGGLGAQWMRMGPTHFISVWRTEEE